MSHYFRFRSLSLSLFSPAPSLSLPKSLAKVCRPDRTVFNQRSVSMTTDFFHLPFIRVVSLNLDRGIGLTWPRSVVVLLPVTECSFSTRSKYCCSTLQPFAADSAHTHPCTISITQHPTRVVGVVVKTYKRSSNLTAVTTHTNQVTALLDSLMSINMNIIINSTVLVYFSSALFCRLISTIISRI
jgi:hypothetical protein